MNPAPIAVLTIDAAHLPLSREKAALLAASLDEWAGRFAGIGWDYLGTMSAVLSVEYDKGEHRDTGTIAIMPMQETGGATS